MAKLSENAIRQALTNNGIFAWSDKYQCVEWPWLNGIVDAMAFGNHDPDYGLEVFTKCRDAVHYPILSANTPSRASNSSQCFPH